MCYTEPENLQELLRKIGILNPAYSFYSKKERKHAQIVSYTHQIDCATSNLSSKRQLVFLDSGCGRAYLSFYLYAYLKEVKGCDIKIIGVDSNVELIKQNQKIAEQLGFDGMLFYASKLEDFTPVEKIDIAYCLHACDKATDYAIAMGIACQASYIYSVSCCQHTSRRQIKKHNMQAVTRHQVYKERLVDMVSDSLRALLLEHHNYGVKIYEFTSSESTPKNVMLRAEKGKVKKVDRQLAGERYNQLSSAFNICPKLYELLEDSFNIKRCNNLQMQAYKQKATNLLRQLQSSDKNIYLSTANRFSVLPEFKGDAWKSISIDVIKRKHALNVVAIESGFKSWVELKSNYD